MGLKKLNPYLVLIALLSVLVQCLLPFTDEIARAARTTNSTATYFIDFNNNNTSITDPGTHYIGSSTLTSNITIPSGAGTATSASVTINGVAKSVTPSGSTITVSGSGQKVNLTGKTESNPGHHFTRTGDGFYWQHKGSRTHNLQFIGPNVSGGVSQYPGPIPDPVTDMDTGSNSFHSQEAYGSDLWVNGLATSYSDNVDPPSWFSDGNNSYYVSSVDPASISITDVQQSQVNATPTTKISVGASTTNPGKGMITIDRPVDSNYTSSGNAMGTTSCTAFTGVDFIDTTLTGGAIDRNYCLTVSTLWAGATYNYQGTITITYTQTAYPDLGNITATSPACVDTTKAYTYTFTFSNSGPNITSPFNVSVAADGVVFSTIPYTSAPTGQLETGSFSYTLTSAKTFTITLDPTNTTGDTNTTNNVYQLPLTPSSTACSGGSNSTPESITGSMSVDYASVSYGSAETVRYTNVTVSGGNNCALKTGTEVYTQNGYSKSYFLNNTGNFQDNFVASPYNGFGAGQVTVEYDIVTTCGTKKTIGPVSFNITIKSGLQPPQFQASWFDNAYYSGYNKPVSMVPVGDLISLGPVQKPANLAFGDIGTPYDPQGDAIIYTWNFAGSSDTWIQNLGDTNTGYGFDPHGDHFSNIKADTKGTHTVQVTAIDTEGASAGPYNITVDIVDPNPVPVITPPGSVIEGRTYTPGFSCASSYSPYANRTIASCDWHNTVQSIYPTAGNYNISLDVTDSAGMVSLNPATYTLAVQPDPPPIPGLSYLNVGIRGTAMTFQDTSQTTLGDPILTHTDQLYCDTGNTGNFTFVQTLTPDNTGKLSWTPSQVEQCFVRIFIQKQPGYQRSATQDFPFTVINQAPSADYTALGQQPMPAKATSDSATGNALLGWPSSLVGVASIDNRYMYNSTDNAIANKNIFFYNTSSYKAVTANVVSINHGSDYYTGGNYPSGCYFGTRLASNLWISQNGSYGFWTYDDTCTKKAGLPNRSGYTFTIYGFNKQADMIIIEHVPGTGNSSTSNIYDYYHISSLASGSSSYYYTESVANHGSPTKWVAPPAVTSTQPSIPNMQSGKNAGGIASAFAQDTNGNNYQNTCVPGFYSITCQLQLVTPSGSIIWTDSTTNSSTVSVAYISSNASTVMEDLGNNSCYILDNKTGARLLGPITFFGGNGDNIAYKSNGQLFFYNMATKATISTGQTRVAGVVAADGKLITVDDGTNLFANDLVTGTQLYTFKTNLKYVGNYNNETNGNGTAGSCCTIRPIGDSKVVIIGEQTSFSSGNATYYYDMAIITTAIDQSSNFKNYGIKSDNNTMYDGDISASIKFDDDTFASSGAGIVFRRSDLNNMYRVEVNPTTINLTKIVNGVRTVLGTQSVNGGIGTYTNIKTHVAGGNITVYYNGVPLPNLTVSDNTFTLGSYGTYSERPYANIKNFVANLTQPLSQSVAWMALVNNSITYTTTYTDPENDPIDSSHASWSYLNTAPQKFLDAGDGASDPVGTNSYNGVVSQSPLSSLAKVGVYKIDYTVPDNPTPAGQSFTNFQSFQKYSDPMTHYVTVVRVPICTFSVTVNSNGSFTWNDTSNDPDRWLSSTNYSTENTGIDYQTTRGILQRKYMYISPSGQQGYSQLLKPSEQGTYQLFEAVADEYGVWSGWTEQDVNTTLVVADNYAPTATLTAPTGTSSSPSYSSTLTPTITWNQNDQDANTTFSAFEMLITDVSGNVVEDYTGSQNTTATSGSWVVDNPLVMGNTYCFQVKVADDGGKWSAYSNIGCLITNRPPSAYMSYPYGTQTTPTVVNTAQPTFQWSQTDPDPGTVFQYFQVQIWDQANTTMLMDSGQYWEGASSTIGSWMANVNLPAGQDLRVRVRVFDGYAWSNWSPDAWMIINRPPTGNIMFSTPIYQNDTPTFNVYVSDPDGNTINTKVDVSFNNGSYTNVISWSNLPSGSAKAFTYGPLNQGVYTLRLTLDDGMGGTYTQTYSFTVLPLSITGKVTHTAEWESYRQQWNLLFPSQFRAADVFWAGEAFELSAQVTDTGTSTKPTSVSAQFIRTGDAAALSSPDYINYSGEMLNTNFVHTLIDGSYAMRFTVMWSNGLVEMADVPITIFGNIYDVIVNQIRE